MFGRYGFAFAAALVLATVALASPTRAATGRPTIIDFDALSDGQPITDQYAPEGVTFEGLTARDFASRPGLAHSGTVAAVVVPTAEFCTTTTVVIRFAEPATRVKVWFGLPERLGGSAKLILRAFAADGSEVGEVGAALTQGDGPRAIDAALELLDPLEPIARAEIAVNGDVPICDLAFDDLEFDSLAAPADLVIGPVGSSATATALALEVPIANQGGSASEPTTITAGAEGWDVAEAAVASIAPGSTIEVSLALQVPAAAVGRTTTINVNVDPAAAQDADPKNNTTAVAVIVPALATDTPPPPETPQPTAGSPAPTGAPTTPTAGEGSGAPLAIVGSALLAVLGGSVYFARRSGTKSSSLQLTSTSATLSVGEDGRSVVLTIDGDGVHLEAKDGEPPDRCAPGQLHCKREALFDLPRRRVASIAVRVGEGPTSSRELGDALAKRATEVARAAGRDPKNDAARLRVNALAQDLARLAEAAIGPGESRGEVVLVATVVGPSATATFHGYRCGQATGSFEELVRTTMKVSDRSEWRLAGVRSSAIRPLPGLLDATVAGIAVLGRQL